ncbi:MAG: hypothetical protein OXD29_04200 [Roseovarius sp.]|nr:hypothetical protein [Roseovarius sp.]
MVRIIVTLLVVMALTTACGKRLKSTPKWEPKDDSEVKNLSVDNDYIWDCALETPQGSFPRRFVISWQRDGLRKNVRLYSANAPSQRLKVETIGAANIFTLRDRSNILIASDGEIYGEGNDVDPGDREPSGMCKRGGQKIVKT